MALAGSRRPGGIGDDGDYDEDYHHLYGEDEDVKGRVFGGRLHEVVVRDYFEGGGDLRLSVRVASRRSALLAWAPPGAFAERELQVVYAPQGAR